MSEKLTRRQLRSLKKANEHKEQRVISKEARQARVGRPDRRPPARRRDWLDDEAAPAHEKLRRGRAHAGVRPDEVPATLPLERVGTVVEVRSGDSLVAFEGRLLRAVLPPGARLPGSDQRSPLAVGDRVALEPAGGVARMVGLLPRRSALVRHVYDPTRRSGVSSGQVLAANIDQVIVVCSPVEPPFRPRLIDRYLVAASRDRLPALICLNKVDLGLPDEVQTYLRGYAALGVPSVRTSALTGAGLDELRANIEGKISLFSGHSGVGKSSLLNTLEPGLALEVGDVTHATAGLGKGRHTTSSARLVALALPDTFVVDSPGIRAFGIRGLPARELAAHFVDLVALAGGCSYRDCLHRGEPGCAVAEAAERRPFLRERLASYRVMLGELG